MRFSFGTNKAMQPPPLFRAFMYQQMSQRRLREAACAYLPFKPSPSLL